MRGRSHRSRGSDGSSRGRGFSLVEMLVVLTIVAMAIGGVTVSFRSLGRVNARSAASHMGSAIRYLYDRAITTGSYYRMVVDLSTGAYYAEKSDVRFFLVRGKEEGDSKGRAPDEEARQKKLDEEDKRKRQQITGSAAALQPPPEPKRARFESFVDAQLPKVVLRGVKIRDLYTRRQHEPYIAGKAYLYFFPDGHTERALVHLEDEEGDVYSLSVHPLTGRVVVKAGDVPVGRDFDVDDEGRTEADR